jgi:hypothetical protein
MRKLNNCTVEGLVVVLVVCQFLPGVGAGGGAGGERAEQWYIRGVRGGVWVGGEGGEVFGGKSVPE